MNDLVERFLELPARQRGLAIVVLLGLVVFLYAYFIYLPRARQIETQETQLSGLEADRAAKTKLAANLPEARKRVTELEADLRKAVAHLPDEREIPELLSAISKSGRDSGLEIVQFRQKPEVFHEFYADVPVEMLVRGSFFQVEAFFGRVAKLERIVNVGNIGIKSTGIVPVDPVNLETNCSTTTFRFLNEAERERIAREKKAKEKK